MEAVLSGTYLDEEIRIPGINKSFIGNRKADEKEATIRTGVKTIPPWWKVDGDWPAQREALVGVNAAEKLGLKRGDLFRAEFGSNNETFKVSGILSTGGDEDGQVIDPSLLFPGEYEIWYCTPYISSIMLQIEEVIDANAKPIRQVADNEGKLLKKFEWLMFLITGIAMTSASLGVSAVINPSLFSVLISGILPLTVALLGSNAANKLGLKAGDMLSLGEKSFKVSGILDTGTSDDNRIFIPMETAEQISGKSGATLVQVNGLMLMSTDLVG